MAKRPTMLTPRGRAIYPRLNAPDTKFDADGVFSVKLAIPTKEAEPITSKLDELFAAKLAEVKKEKPGKKIKEADLPYSLNPENEDETIINFKMKAQYKAKDGTIVKMAPKLFDAKGKPLSKPLPNIGGGSTLKVSFEPDAFYVAALGVGVSLRLKAVQLLDLVEYGGGGNAESYGFGSEDGYETSAEDDEQEKSEDEPEETEESEAAGSDGSDF